MHISPGREGRDYCLHEPGKTEGRLVMTTAILEVSPYRRIVSKTVRQRRLFSVLWELTYRCNEKCSHCYLTRPESDERELTTAEARSVIDQLAEMGALHLTLTGGEPLLRKDFLDIARYARERGFALRLLTNGSLITATVADALRDLHPVGIEMSLLGAQSSTHDRLTGAPGSYERTVGAFRLLSKRGVHTTVKTPLMNDNVEEFDQVRRLAGELGAAFRYDITIVPKDNGCACVLSHRLTDERLVDFFRKELPDEWVTPNISPEDRPCSAASNLLCISPYGDAFPCAQIRLAAGNVRIHPIRTIWSESPLLGEIRGLVEGAFPVCSACRLRSYCKRCMGVGWLEDGELRGPSSVACREASLRRQILVEKGAIT